MASSRLNEPTIGIDPPLPTSAAGLPHSASSARRARRNAWFLIDSEMAGLPAWLMNSAFTSGGSRDVTKERNGLRDALRVLLADEPERNLGAGLGRQDRLCALRPCSRRQFH